MAVADENPYAAPKADMDELNRRVVGPQVAWRDGRILVVRKGTGLPDRCIRCNAPTHEYRFAKRLDWVKPIWMVTMLFPLLFVLIYILLRQRGVVAAGLCGSHRRWRILAMALGWLTALAGIGVFFLVAPVAGQWAGVVVLASFALLLGGALGGVFGSRVLIPTKIDKNFIWLARMSPDYLAEFGDWNT